MSAVLSVLAPVLIDDSKFVSSTVPEADYTAWSSSTTYALGDRCISAHRVYESQKAGNINRDPTVLTNQFGAVVYWLDVGPTVRWAMFDSEVSTQTVIASTLTVVLRPGVFDALFLGGLDATAVAISVKDAPGGAVVFTYSGSLEGSAPSDYYEFFFDPFKPLRNKLISGIPQYSDPEITVTLTGGTVKCGVLAVGNLKALGRTMHGAKAKPKTYSYINTDAYGNTQIKRRKATTDMTATAYIEHIETRLTQEILQEVLDVACVWVCSDSTGYSGLSVFGLGSGEVSYDSATHSILSLSVQGLI